MNQILDIVLPVFGLIGLGYLAASWRMLTPASGQGLADFVFNIAIPLLIFRTVATANFSGGSAWGLWAAYYTVFAVAWVAGTLVTRKVFGRDARAGLVGGISAAYSNALLIGLPLVITAYGTEGAAAVTLLIAVHLPVVMTVSAILIERALVVDGLAAAETRAVAVMKSVGRNLIFNPVIIGLFAGLLWRFTGIPIAGPGGILLDRLADVAATLALFSVGMSLRNYGVTGHVLPAIAIGLIKLVAMPALVLTVTRYLIPLPPVWAKALVITAACPTGVNAYIIAARFKTGQALASNCITLTTAAAVVAVALWLRVVEWV
jgi:malonate transporter